MVLFLANWLEISGEETHQDGHYRELHIQLLHEEHPQHQQVPVRVDPGGEHREPYQQDEVEALLVQITCGKYQ